MSAAAWVTAAIAVASLAQTPPAPEPQTSTGFDSATYASQRPEPPSAAAAAQIAVVRDGGRIDVNQADAITLQLLPGVGPVVSQRIIADRAEHGPYPTLEAMTRVTGIGPRTVERIAALAYAGSGDEATDAHAGATAPTVSSAPDAGQPRTTH
ncbi:MAG: helix-hairpin-helix domain-containing protein [Sandaracinaceae bacterium]|nr:helix-hairpin-helix domain-containing protein [Myxococcales bacterium]MCB9659267.1 helix-hairpin-helix domain-containing protein [Sandaracinaceae bacterium]